MASLIPFNGIHPEIDESCFIAPDTVITGDVKIGQDSSIWFKSIIRGDVCKIRIGKRVNIQDASILHGTLGRSETVIGDNVSIGHMCIIHGCTIEPNVLIGMGAIILDNAHIESNCIVAAGAVVLEDSTLESGFLYGGVPAKKIKPIDTEKLNYVEAVAEAYVHYGSQYKKEISSKSQD